MARGVGWLRQNRASVILTSGGADVGILALAVQDLQGRKNRKAPTGSKQLPAARKISISGNNL
ncbi:hypothetical protein ALQ15_116263 [Pseudomonas syringae pv. actinidiae]|uniref:Uncharacterized protein n=1 Tax=Pseudomonas syringae pv. actinidiae TaxID=103796 RepID=A0A7Z6U3Z5_PSESF|nr:hypothetical protein ALQ15_116263 [Pseudomonas syringae pv. actinidiae]